MLRALLVVAMVLAPGFARAADFAWNVGAIEVVGEPGSDHLGVYPYAALSAVVPVGKVAIIPAVGVEWSPEFGHWGFVGTITADYALGKRVGLDLNVAFIHDQQDHHWSDAAFLAGGGPGCSFYLDKWTVSPYLSWFQGLNASGGAIVPGVNIARTF
ncbi:MAG TPA: hypothetical protein VMV18_02510 [bacterium]|nr:hypothetical protein [bacterium]